MKIGFIVGEIEQHQMELTFDQPSGDLRILLDGTQVLQDSPTLVSEPVKQYELSIGEQERHKLALQLTYGEQTDEIPGEEPSGLPIPVLPIPRLSLKLTAISD